jgi:hypothetical protein
MRRLMDAFGLRQFTAAFPSRRSQTAPTAQDGRNPRERIRS